MSQHALGPVHQTVTGLLHHPAHWGRASSVCQESGQEMLWDEQAAAARARMWAKSLAEGIFSFSVPSRNHLGCWFAYRALISTAAASQGVLSSRGKKKGVKTLKGKNSNDTVRIVKTMNNSTFVKLNWRLGQTIIHLNKSVCHGFCS